MFIAMLALMLPLIVSVVACGSSGPPAIGDVVVAKRLDADKKPVESTSTYQPEDTIYISVQVNDLVIGSSVEVQYKLNGEVYEKSILTADEAGSGYYGFSLSPSSLGHSSGTYNAEIYLDGVLAKTVTFTVEGGQAGIIDIILSNGLDANDDPIAPTTTFNLLDTIYVTVSVNNVRAGAELKFVVEFAGSDAYQASTSESSMIIQQAGAGQYTNFFSPPTDGSGFATGNYTVLVYLDGVPFGNPIPFTVTD